MEGFNNVLCYPAMSHSQWVHWAPSRLLGRLNSVSADYHSGWASAASPCLSVHRLVWSQVGCSWSQGSADCEVDLGATSEGCSLTDPGFPAHAASWMPHGAAWGWSVCCSWGWAPSGCRARPSHCGLFQKSCCVVTLGSWPAEVSLWGPAPASCCTCGVCAASSGPREN